MKLVIHCDAIVRVADQMQDLSTSRVSLNMQQPNVSRLVMWTNSGIRGTVALAVTNTTRMSLLLILRISLYHSSERQYPDDTQMQVESLRVKLGALMDMLYRFDTCTNEGSRSNCKCTDIFNWSDEMRGITAA